MSDIQPGDVVVYVDDRPNPSLRGRHKRLRVGGLYRVVEVAAPAPHRLYGTTAGLRLAGVVSASRTGYFACARFRKLNDEPDNAELIERIRKCKPIKTGVPARNAISISSTTSTPSPTLSASKLLLG